MTGEYTVTIKPRRGWMGINLPELWRYRELLYIFVWRDIKVRYKQTVLGIVWAMLQPFLLMVVFTLFFGNLAKIPSNGQPYAVFVFSGLLFWNYFSTALTAASNSLVDNENMLKKIYFPRIILPLSPTLTPLVDFGFSFIIMLGIGFYFHAWPTALGLAMLPILLVITFMAAAGLGFFLAAVNVRYRDIRFVLPFFIQSLLFVTPIIYPVTLIPARYQWLLSLNPLTGIIEASRAVLTGHGQLNSNLLGVSALISIVIFTFGIFYFRRTEGVFADIA